jgi:hypothetical protein
MSGHSIVGGGKPFSPSGLSFDEPWIIKEAFYRGGTPELILDWLWWKRDQMRPGYRHAYCQELQPNTAPYRSNQGPDRYDLIAGFYNPVMSLWQTYQKEAEAEFNALGTVRYYFADPAKDKDGSADPASKLSRNKEFYKAMRPVYYNLGYDHPAHSIFSKIKDFTIFQHQVNCGLHEKFIEFLQDFRDLYPSLAALDFGNSGGFVPRNIAGSDQISNHALGLALDLKPESNPRIATKLAIQELNSVVKEEGGMDFDFGELPGGPNASLEQIDAESRKASEAVGCWIDEHLPKYKSLQEKIARGADEAKQARKEIEGDRNLKRLKIINDSFTVKQLEAWRKSGIYTLPFSLVISMHALASSHKYAGIGFRYGGNYNHSKDYMHFEIQYSKAIPPDSKRRSLTDLFQAQYFADLNIRTIREEVLAACAPSRQLDSALSRGALIVPFTTIRSPR